MFDIQRMIKEHGFAVIGVFGEHSKPSFAYTVGLFEKHGYELLVIGLPGQIATMIFNHIGAELANGATLELNVPDDRWANLPCKFIEADRRARDYVYQADDWYDEPVKVLQMVLPDKHGKFPGEPGFDKAMSHIPVLTNATTH